MACVQGRIAFRREFVGALLALVVASTSWAGVAVQSAGVASGKAHDFRDKNFDYFVAGDPTRPRATHTEAGFALMGGGGGMDAAFSFIAKHAGGGRIVVLRAVDQDEPFDATDGEYGDSFKSKWGPVTSAETIVFRNREAASDPRVIAALRGADGIFLGGGDQSRYIRYWKGTPVQDALNAHIRAHRPIGGTSAGLAVLGQYSYTAMDGGSLESKVALDDPFGAGTTLETDFLHAASLARLITDTHFSARSRLGRLIVFVARLNASEKRGVPVVGLGVDEKSALLVDENGIGRLADGSAGSAWLVQEPSAPRDFATGHALTIDGVRITRIDRDSRIDVRARKVTKPGAETTIAIERGAPAPNALVGKMLRRDVVPKNED